MKPFSSFRSVISALFHRTQVETDTEEELRAHVQNRADDLERSGLPRAEAQRRARIEFGAHEKFKEECREAAGTRFAYALWQDSRFGCRMLRKSPAFTAIAVLTLALGIGASTAIFSVVESVLWRPLPFPDSERLTALWSTNLKETWRAEPVSAADYLDWRAQTTAFEQLAAFDWGGRHTLSGNGEAESVFAMPVSVNFFDVLQVRPAMGGAFRPEETEPGKNRVAVIGHSLWERRFHSDPTLVGKSITLDGEQYALTGVCSANFHLEFLGRDPDLFIPLTLNGAAARNRANRLLGIVGR